MHLVDAIRMASQQSQEAASPQPASAPAAAQQPSPQPGPPPIPGAGEVREPTEVSPAVIGGGGSVVRLELFLSPEQMHMMLRGILQGAHTVMTLREAAQHFRTSAQSLIAMAESGELPAFMVDGQWKFPRQGLEEWMTLQTLRSRTGLTQEESNAA
jgi:excisionase family DNA binding protein